MENTYILGQPGTGKRHLILENSIDCIRDGHGLFLVDTDGTLTDAILDAIPKNRRKHVIWFDPTREDLVLPWNPLSGEGTAVYRGKLFCEAVKGAWNYSDLSTPDMSTYLSFTIASLIDAGKPLHGLLRMLKEESYRKSAYGHLKNPVILDHWREYDELNPREARAEAKSTLNKLKLILADTRIGRSLIHTEGLDFSEVVGKNRIFVATLHPSKLSDEDIRFLASLLLASCGNALRRRSNRTPFHLFLPECDRFAPSIAIDLLQNAHRYDATVTASHQYIDQIPPPYFSALMGTCARKFVFRTSEDDARVLDRHIKRNQNVAKFEELGYGKARKFPFDEQDFYRYVSPVELTELYRRDIEDHLTLTRFVKAAVADRKVEEFFCE